MWWVGYEAMSGGGGGKGAWLHTVGMSDFEYFGRPARGAGGSPRDDRDESVEMGRGGLEGLPTGDTWCCWQSMPGTRTRFHPSCC